MRRDGYHLGFAWIRCCTGFSLISLCAGALLLACGSDGGGTSTTVRWPSSSPHALPSGASVDISVSAGPAHQVCAAISEQTRNYRTPADIIIAVDNSGSMSEEIAFVRDQLNVFSELIVRSGIDVRIVLISAAYTPELDLDDEDDEGDEGEDEENLGLCIAPPLGSGSCPLDSRVGRYLHVPQEVGSHDALELFIDTFPSWSSVLRPESNKMFVVVTDDDADGFPRDTALWFRQSVAALPGALFSKWSFSGIYCFSACPEAAAVGSVYDLLVGQTHGVAGDLCRQDFAPVFEALARAVVESSALACEWDIPAPPLGLAFEHDQVNVHYSGAAIAPGLLLRRHSAAACGIGDGWYYDDAFAPTRVLVCPATCESLQRDQSAAIDVLFGCESQIFPD